MIRRTRPIPDSPRLEDLPAGLLGLVQNLVDAPSLHTT